MFKVVPDQLKISDGWVRCGHCADVFDATLHLEDWTPTPGADTGPRLAESDEGEWLHPPAASASASASAPAAAAARVAC